MVELLAPAGDEKSAYAALDAGADAVYLGLRSFSARAFSENFDEGALSRVTQYAHMLGARVYVALNTLVKDSETQAFFAAVRAAWEGGADAVLLQDLFLGREIKRLYPEIVLHLSTQAGCCNVYGARVAKEYGFSRVVLARETPLSDIAAISSVIETEVFVQGALCTCFSGQCYLSSFAGGNSGNRGRCKQPCRKRYRFDRKGYEELAYALSTADLMVADRIQELLAAGVASLKIEGRMRREEYVSAAVEYYRALLAGERGEAERERLVRAYNRGDYTEGLSFGQRRFLSRNVQGHIGEQIGRVTFRHGMPVCLTKAQISKGDGLKILRAGREVGGALVKEYVGGVVLLSSSETLAEGDEVRLTSAARNALPLHAPKRLKTALSLTFLAGEPPRAAADGFVFTGEEPLPAARNAPLSAEEIGTCFAKTELPLALDITVRTDGVFLPKSALNAFRRAFYTAYAGIFSPVRSLCEASPAEPFLPTVRGSRRARIGERREAGDDIFICKPRDYAHIEIPQGGENYLWLPPLWTQADEALVAPVLGKFDGIYAEGSYGIALAEKYGVKFFAGTGCNLTNRFAAAGMREKSAYFALSKELTRAEADTLAADGAFSLAGGDLKVMDLCYCPFERTCAACDKKTLYRMTDENGRVFPIRRYRTADTVCRFEVYNCAFLKEGETHCSRLYDDSTPAARPAAETRGHYERSLL